VSISLIIITLMLAVAYVGYGVNWHSWVNWLLIFALAGVVLNVWTYRTSRESRH